MKEELLHFVWRYHHYDADRLYTTRGEKLHVINPGLINTDAGPDFKMAHVRIDQKDWHGQVEIHVRASDWVRHKHTEDPSYANVILHVVHSYDTDIYYKDGTVIPCLELKDKIPLYVFRNYDTLVQKLDWIPCAGMLQGQSSIYTLSWLERLIIERLEQKTGRLEALLTANNNHWEKTLYQWLAYGFGLRVNSSSFLELSKKISLKLVGKYRDRPKTLQALFFGMGGFLSDQLLDKYPKNLWSEFNFLTKKHPHLKVSPIHWKFHRMRPTGFPTIRLSQFVNFIQHHPALLSTILEEEHYKNLDRLFDLEAHPYWANHSKFDKLTKKTIKKTGTAFRNQLFINVIVPFVFYYGIKTDEQKYKDRALAWLQKIKAEKNSLIKRWEAEGIQPHHAADTQALYYLKTSYCDAKKCLSCHFGHQLIKKQ